MQKAKKRLFSVTAVLLAVLVALTALLPTAGAAQAATMKSKYTGKSYTHNARFDKLEVLNGVDISAWQEKVDWKKIKNDGIDFAILRAGYGKKASQEDAYFATNFKNATAAGLPVGIYWYSYAKSVADVEKEARLCLQVLGSRTLDLPVFYDLEESSQLNRGKAFCTQLVERFCSIIAAAGHTPRWVTNRASPAKSLSATPSLTLWRRADRLLLFSISLCIVSPTYSLQRSTNGYYNRRLANFYAKVNSTNQWCGGGVVYFRRLRDLREDRDLKQTDVAALLGIRQTVYSRYERGYQNLPLEHLLALADYYGVSTDYILGRTNDPTIQK